MKTASFGISCFLITVFTIIGVLQVCNSGARAMNLQDNLQEAMEMSLSTAMDEKSYTIRNKDELVADVVEGIALYLDDNCDIEINVKEADPVTGILSIQATAYYYPAIGAVEQPDGTQKLSEVSVERTVILEQYDVEMAGKHSITYYLKDEASVYKQYLLTEGHKIFVPIQPKLSGKTFQGWKLNNRGSVLQKADIEAMTLDKDYEFYAVFR